MDHLRYIVLLGKVGHGKTRLLNSLTGSNFDSSAAASSCTRNLQRAIIPGTNVEVVDTPGFYSSEDVAGHANKQIEAFEQPISGVYIVIRLGDPSEMAEVANRMMDFTGEEDVRVIGTYVDTVESEVGFDGYQVALQLSELLDIPKKNITLIGKHTDSYAMQSFVLRTLHAPKQIQVSSEQRAVVSSLSGLGSRKFNREIDDLDNVLKEASIALDKLQSLSNGEVKTFATSLLIRKAQSDFKNGCSQILSRARKLLPNEEYAVTKKVEELKASVLVDFTKTYTEAKDTGYNGRRTCQGRSRGRGYTYGQHDNSRDNSREDGPSCQPPNQATRDLESALFAFLLDHCGAKRMKEEEPIPSVTPTRIQECRPAAVSPMSSTALNDSLSTTESIAANLATWKDGIEWEQVEEPKAVHHEYVDFSSQDSFLPYREGDLVRGPWSPYQADVDVEMCNQFQSNAAWNLPLFRQGGWFHGCLD